MFIRTEKVSDAFELHRRQSLSRKKTSLLIFLT